jgi:hypothetical protein
MTVGVAARFSKNIAADIERGYSYAGWSLYPARDLETFFKELNDKGKIEETLYNAVYYPDELDSFAKLLYGLEEDEDGNTTSLTVQEALDQTEINYANSSELGGYMEINSGLCAFFVEGDEDAWADAKQEAIETALADSRFEGCTLYTFKARFIERDPHDSEIYSFSCCIVSPIGQPELITR